MAKALLLFFMVIPTAAFAVDSVETELIPMSLKVMGALTLVLGVMLLLYAVLKKSGRWLPAGQNREINLIEVRYLAPKRALYLIEVNGSKLLLAGTGERLESLAQWPVVEDEPPSFDHLLKESKTPASPSELEQ